VWSPFCSCKLRNPKVAPQPTEIQDSTIPVVCCSCIKHFQTPKPNIGWAPYLFRNFAIRRLMSCNVLHRELVNPKTRKYGSHLYLFRTSRNVLRCCLTFETPKPRNSKIRWMKCGSLAEIRRMRSTDPVVSHPTVVTLLSL
jgi:hypothetical protein